ncbi:MAG: drug/metabolite transporter (DMT)-like permease, partial [Alteromonas naphthalenivorans]
MISLFTFGCILTSILTNIFYNIKIKQSYNKIFTCLLTLILTYSFFPLFFLITKTIETGSLFIGFTNLTKILTDNIILYSFIGVLRVGIAFLYGYLMANYTLAQITLVLQLGILLYPLSYYLLGNTTSLQSLLGIFVITLGCLI